MNRKNNYQYVNIPLNKFNYTYMYIYNLNKFNNLTYSLFKILYSKWCLL